MKRLMAILAITLLTLGIGCVQVGTDEVGVKTVYLSATGETGVKEASYGTGYHMYVPPLVGFTVLKKTEQKLEMTRHEAEGSRPGADDLKLKSTDGNNVWIDITLSWQVLPDQAWMVVNQVGESIDEIEEQAVRPIARGILRDTLGMLSAEEFYDAALREQQVKVALTALNQALNPLGLAITDVMINDYRFEDRYQKAIEDRKLYDQKSREYQSLIKAAEEDAKRKVFDARAEANRLIEAATGQLEQAKLEGDALLYAAGQEAEAVLAGKQAEARALDVLAKALARPGGANLVASRLAQALQGKEITVVPMTDGGTVSLVDINRFLESVAAAKAVQKTPLLQAPETTPAPEKKPEKPETESGN